MDQQTPPKPPKPTFGAWQPKAKDVAAAPVLKTDDLKGLSPDDAAVKVTEFLRVHKGFRKKTATQRRYTLRRIFGDFAQRGLDLSNVTSKDAVEWREFLRQLVEDKHISESYAATLVKCWNAMRRDVFGESGLPGQGFFLKGFRMHVKKIKHLTEEDMVALIDATDRIVFRNEHNRKAFRTYLELVWSTGCRVGSLIDGNLHVGDIDWDRQVLRFRHMKNTDEHTAILTKRATLHLRKYVNHLARTPLWKASETPLFSELDGTLMTYDFVHRALAATAVEARLTKKVSTHVLRKSVGTLIGRDNPKFGAQQLGVTDRIFNLHYNQPLLEDRMAKRDLLPGGSWKPQSPEEIAGAALFGMKEGRVAPEEFDATVERARQMKSIPTDKKDDISGYV